MSAVLVFVGALLLATAPAHADLFEYVARHEPAARAKVVFQEKESGVTVTTIDLVSQTWRGKTWRHEVQVYRPEAAAPGDLAVLAISGSETLGRELARRTGRPVATLSDVPNQPLYFGKREDDLLAHTFAEYLRSGEEDWPLLFPMTKAAVAAMNALAENGIAERFVVTGASKRGWTSWLAGVVDERVVGIVPVVFDNLSFGAQMKHQTVVWGAYSDELSDYTLRGLQLQIDTPLGAKLVAMVDPIAYRAKLGRLRKLIVNGTNDPYWTTDAIRQYWGALEGEKSVLYVPNGGHGIAEDERVLAATAAFVRRVAAGKPMPKVELEARLGDARVETRILSDEPPSAARIWIARDGRADFRRTPYRPIEATSREGAFVAGFPAPKADSVALLAEVAIGAGDERFHLSTPVRVLGAEAP